MIPNLTLFAVAAALGGVSGLSMLLHSRRNLTPRNVISTMLTGGLLSFMAVAWWYGDASTDNPWPAWALAVGIGMSQPKSHELAERMQGVLWAIITEMGKQKKDD